MNIAMSTEFNSKFSMMYFYLYLELEKYWRLVVNLMMKGYVIYIALLLNFVFIMFSSQILVL